MNERFAAALLRWYDGAKRSLPWRETANPYNIWLSEIMLQQTRVETAERYYRAFLARFADVHALARASEDEVLKLWEGLGYYSRARNMHRAARLISGQMGGEFPRDAEGLRQLPGIGPYTSCAISSIAFSQRVPALDGNQARVLTRVFMVDALIKSPADLWDIALPLVDAARPGDYNQALMDLASSICTPRRPDCPHCPVQQMCGAHLWNNPEAYPWLPAPISKREEFRAVALVLVDGRILVRKRPSKGLLGGMWEFPSYENANQLDICARLSADGVVNPSLQGTLPGASHIFTHKIWRMTGFLLSADGAASGWTAADANLLGALAFPSALKVYLALARDALDT